MTPPADLLPAQIKAPVVSVVLGGPGWGHGFSEVFWNVAPESEAPFWGPWRPPFNYLWGTLRFPSPTWQGWGHRPTQEQDGAAVTQLSPHRPGSGWGLLTSHPSSAHCAASPGRKEAAGQLWAWQPGVCLPTKASRPRPADASSSGEGRGRSFLEPN